MTQTNADSGFSFPLSALAGWVCKRKDGSTIRYNIDDTARSKVKALAKTPTTNVQVTAGTSGGHGPAYAYGTGSLSSWCDHLGDKPMWIGKNANGEDMTITVCNVEGSKKTAQNFDFVIDGGATLYTYEPINILKGDPELSTALAPYNSKILASRILRIDWADRQAPDLLPQFWEELVKRVSGKVMTACQGGHGRSGSAAVCMMLALTDYDALDAITHLRAVHCPRAIESTVQHDYINRVAKYFGRTENAHEAEKVKDFRKRFMEEMSQPWGDVFREAMAKELVKDVK